jgi:hypothetical protein
MNGVIYYKYFKKKRFNWIKFLFGGRIEKKDYCGIDRNLWEY